MKWLLILILLAFGDHCLAGNYTNFAVSIYIPVNVVNSFSDPQKLADDWLRISRQAKVDKVYIEVQRDRATNSDALLEQVKQFFIGHGVQVAGGMAPSLRVRLNWRRGILTKSFRMTSFSTRPRLIPTSLPRATKVGRSSGWH